MVGNVTSVERDDDRHPKGLCPSVERSAELSSCQLVRCDRRKVVCVVLRESDRGDSRGEKPMSGCAALMNNSATRDPCGGPALGEKWRARVDARQILVLVWVALF